MANQTAKSLKGKALGDLEAGKLPQALKKAQLGIKKFPKDTDFQAIAGFVFTELKQYKKSIPHFVEAARRKPDDPQFAENLANALMQTGQIPRALAYAEKMLEQFPNNAELVRVVDEIQLKGSNWREIVEHATEKLKKSPDDVTLLTTRARAYDRIGFSDNCRQDAYRAYELAPDDNAVAFQKASILHQEGKKKDAAEILDRIITNDPAHVASLLQLSNMADEDRARDLEPLVAAAIDNSDHPISQLEFAKAQITSVLHGLTAAMPGFARANELQHELNPYKFGDESQKLRRIVQLFPEIDTPISSEVVDGPTPIFVIGQPRSGTTLMEMMLSSIPDVAGCGELTVGPDLSYDFIHEGKAYDAKDAEEFARDFRRLMPPVPETSIAFVDKLPHNYQQVGFLLSAFPNAKVINMMRDPRDVGLSKWIRRFPAPGMRYASNLEAIGHSANMYRKYIAHWETIFGDRILTVPYEKLVADPETYSRQVADFLGLEWHETMMHPEKNKKQVRTASIDQVRKKISTKSIGGWNQVADHIQPMLNGFDPELWPEYDLS